MTIGRPQGAVWIGKPIDVVIPLALDAAEAGGSLCLGAEVLQGDAPMLERRVTVSLESGNSPGNSSIHVRTTVPVDEPVVTVTVRAGCDMRSTRSYVLLADVPSDVTPPGVAMAGARPSADAAPVARPTARPASRTAGGGGGAASPDGSGSSTARRVAARSSAEHESAAQAAPQASAPVAPAPRRAAPVVPRAVPAAPPAAATPPKAEAVAAGPRLQVEALEPEPARDTGLKSTTQIEPPPAENPARRAAAAALWGAMNPTAEQAQRENQRSKELETTLAALREQTAQNQRALLELRSELAQARESQFRNPLVYALIAGLLLALIALLLMWRASRRAAATAWWRESVLQPEGGDGAKRLRRDGGLLDDDESDTDAEDEPPKKRTLGRTTFGATPFAPLEPDDDGNVGAPPPARAIEAAAVRPVNTEELFDVQQQSDFFLSLGQQDQAIDVLREHIAANPGTSALAYLDLLRIYHSLDRREDYARLAEEFERAFNADVPPFDKYTDAGKGLERYPSALARIESQWPAPSTLALIEELIFRKPGVHEDDAFDLAAYQELLLLYGLAKEVIEPDTAPPAAVAPAPFTDTHSATATASLWPDTVPPVMPDGPTLPPSIYGSIDDRLHHDTVMAPDMPIPPAHHEERDTPPRVVPPPELDLAEFDKTAYETMPTPIEPPKPPAPSGDPHVIDFELFDPATEAEIAPKSKSVKR
ncbi:type IV pilus assembly protein FimV [Variovorax sp. HW608]|uniref:type IV pilus assembly protein FimV n=1 Tax=Variovorax sp. HW608 TaxID=1034889 RepID=UPI000B5AE3AF|nr:hypothetical protein [Variovorax sp. HW608]